ncbi:K+-sensing histidine kinase KdpD [Sphingobium sp. B8D3A]|nr:hypothetical protein [Sphingobium sp. B8D3D]MCW2415975.1 K+-sensing histidine kinase KdpD [Sphingobium sp. B8D3A]
MTAEQLASAFELGTRCDLDKPGAGLGLAIAREICAGIAAQLELSTTENRLSSKRPFLGLGWEIAVYPDRP